MPTTPRLRAARSSAVCGDGWRGPAQLWQQAAKTLVFMKHFSFTAHYSGAVWRN
jgi:hypothetical protein